MRLLGGATEPSGRTEARARHSDGRKRPGPPSPAFLDMPASATTPAAGPLVSAWPEAVISSVKPRRAARSGDGRGPPRSHRGRRHSWPGRSSDARNPAIGVGGSRKRVVRGGGGALQGRQAVTALCPSEAPCPLPALPSRTFLSRPPSTVQRRGRLHVGPRKGCRRPSSPLPSAGLPLPSAPPPRLREAPRPPRPRERAERAPPEPRAPRRRTGSRQEASRPRSQRLGLPPGARQRLRRLPSSEAVSVHSSFSLRF